MEMKNEGAAPPRSLRDLTRPQRKRLAKEMRGLALDCLENGPQMADLWCGCAIGIAMHRAGLWADDCAASLEYEAAQELAQDIDELLSDTGEISCGVVSLATRERMWRGNPTAVVFPLFASADLVEGFSEQPRAAPTKALPVEAGRTGNEPDYEGEDHGND